MALVELYREIGQPRYLELAGFFLDQRGRGTLAGGRDPAYYQDHVPVRQATGVAGHAVRQLYLLAGVTDAYLETGERALFEAATRQWQDVASGKLYVTGGLGSRYEGEAFGEAYELPNDRGYCETCAAIASILWNWRMLLATGEARFADLIERALLNGFLSGVSLDGRRFFYVNPLLSRGGAERAEWYSCAGPSRKLGAFGKVVRSATTLPPTTHRACRSTSTDPPLCTPRWSLAAARPCA